MLLLLNLCIILDNFRLAILNISDISCLKGAQPSKWNDAQPGNQTRHISTAPESSTNWTTGLSTRFDNSYYHTLATTASQDGIFLTWATDIVGNTKLSRKMNQSMKFNKPMCNTWKFFCKNFLRLPYPNIANFGCLIGA